MSNKENRCEENSKENKKEITKVGNHDLIELLESETLLTESVCKSLVEAKEFIASTYTDVPMYRPLPVKLFGVLNDKNFPTPDAKFWQCKVEAEVHANELIRDIHDLELSKIELEKINVLINKISQRKTENSRGLTDIDLQMIDLDLREQQVYLSRKRFEIKQIEKRIRYRIDEVTEWKKISDNLLKIHGNNISPEDYVNHYINKLKHNLNQKLNDPEESEENKINIKKQIDFIDRAVTNFS